MIGIVVVGLVFVFSLLSMVFSLLLFQDKKAENARLTVIELQLTNIETYLKQLSEEVESSIDDPGPIQTLDGRFRAINPEDLLKQILDSQGRIDIDLSKMTPNDFQKFLNDINSEPPFDEEEDDESEDWKNK